MFSQADVQSADVSSNSTLLEDVISDNTASEGMTTEFYDAESSGSESLDHERQTYGSQSADSAIANTTANSSASANSVSTSHSTDERSLGALLVGLSVDGITTVEATLVKGREDGVGAIAFNQWLVPFDDAIAAAGANLTRQSSSQLYIRAPGVAKVIDPTNLTVDPDLGLVLSIAEISEILNLDAEFDFRQYAINFRPVAPDGFDDFGPNPRNAEPPIVTAGLPIVSPTAGFNLGGVRQSTGFSGSVREGVNAPVGELTAIGSLGGGSWYTRINQPALNDTSTWQLSELQYVHQSDEIDYTLGTQPTFWPSQNTGSDYWGATTLQRLGFVPSDASAQSGFSPQRRMQAINVERSVTGEAEPGTFVQLTEGISGRVVAETLVDSSGLYQFEGLPASTSLNQQHTNRGYVVKLYADGLLTNVPEVRSASLTTFPGHLPKGASALIASAGFSRQRSGDRFVGSFDGFRGGIAYRVGASESLSLGGGIVIDNNRNALLEAFYLPEDIPLQANMSALIDLETGLPQVTASARYQPAENLAVQFNSNRFSQSLSAEWRAAPRLRFNVAGNTREQAISVGANASYRSGPWAGSLAATVDTQQQVRWNALASNGNFKVVHRGNELSTRTEATYRFPTLETTARLPGVGHELALSYDTITRDLSFGADSTGTLALVEWRYRSPQIGRGSQSPWAASLGYGVGAQGAGAVASVNANLGYGFELRARYQGVSAFDNNDSFSVSLVSRLGNHGGLRWGHSRQDRLRSQGGLLVQPFFDDNANGQRDAEERLYLESPELLVALNNLPISTYQSDTTADGLLLTMKPDTYRVEIDPAGLPLDRAANIGAYAVDIAPGQYTTLPVPLSLSYTVSGVVVDAEGVVVSGARVEAVSEHGHRQVSITNGAGVYYLERLKPEAYEMRVGGVLVENGALQLEGEINTFQTRELKLAPDTNRASIPKSPLPYGLTMTI